MKQFNCIFLLLFGLLTQSASAQIPNGDFETWDIVNGYENPRYWDNYNSMTSGFGVLTCQRGVISGTSDSYLKLVTDTVDNLGILAGFALCGSFGGGLSEPLGFPYTQRPSALIGKWQYEPQEMDNGIVYILFTKWDQQNNKRDTIGAGVDFMVGSVTSWESFSIPVTFANSDNPDSCLILFSASTFFPTPGSYLYLNDLAFDFNSGIAENGTPRFKIFPNPSSSQIQLDLNGLTDVQSVELIDMKGRVVDLKITTMLHQAIDVSGFSQGIYFIRVKTKTTVVTERFSKL